MKIAGIEGKTLALYGGLGVGLYFFVTKLLPQIVAGLAKGAGDTAKAAIGGTAESAGKTAGSLVKASGMAVDSFLEELGLPPQSLEKLGSGIGTSLYDAVHAFSPQPGGPDLFYSVNFPDGARHSIASTVVDSKGRFKYQNVMYQIKDTTSGAHYATRL